MRRYIPKDAKIVDTLDMTQLDFANVLLFFGGALAFVTYPNTPKTAPSQCFGKVRREPWTVLYTLKVSKKDEAMKPRDEDLTRRTVDEQKNSKSRSPSRFSSRS